MSKHQKSQLDRARDELMSHVVRCDVLQATMDDRHEWLEDTLEYMQGRYPGLGDLQRAQLEMIGRQFIKPVIPHGAGNTASNRPDPVVGTVEEAPADAESDSADAESDTVVAESGTVVAESGTVDAESDAVDADVEGTMATAAA